MNNYEEKDYKVFDLFRNQWALVSAGTWSILILARLDGEVWVLYGEDRGNGAIVTVYSIRLATCDF